MPVLSTRGPTSRDSISNSSTNCSKQVEVRPPERAIRTFRLAIVCDYPEEGWVSMDLCAEMLEKYLAEQFTDRVQVTRLCPAFRRRVSAWEPLGGRQLLFNADRVINRQWEYPRWLSKRQHDFDLFHIIDHSYAHLVHSLPAERTVVTCNDLDAFRCLVDGGERRSWPFRMMTRRLLSGLQKAARVPCISRTTASELYEQQFVAKEKTVSVPLAADPVFSPHAHAAADRVADGLLGKPEAQTLDILHVGSTIPRKRIDVLLQVFAAVQKVFPSCRLIRAGGKFTDAQQRLADELGIARSIVVLPFLERDVLAAIYRRATVVLQPSQGEGFGLPVVEAMACGAAVIASDLPVLAEVGGDAVRFCPVADIPVWTKTVVSMLNERQNAPETWADRRRVGLAQAAKFSWKEHVTSMMAVYEEVLEAAGDTK